MKLRKVRIQLRMHKIHLHVQFPCLVTFAFKVGRQQIQSPQSIKLEQGKAIFSSGIILNTQIPYDYHTHQYNQRKASIMIYIVSQAIGKNIAGISNFQWSNALDTHLPCSYTRHFQRCPDKEAMVEFSVKAEFMNHKHNQLTPDTDILKKTKNITQSRYLKQSSSLDKKVRVRCKSIVRQDQFTSRDSPISPRQLHKSTYTPITSRVQQTVRRTEQDLHKIQFLKLELVQKQKWIKKLEAESQGYRYQLIGLRQDLDRYKHRQRPRDVSVNRQNQRLKSRCQSLEQVIEQLKQFRLRTQKDNPLTKQNKQTLAKEQYVLKNKHLQQQVNYYKKAKQSVEQSLKQHLRSCKIQLNQYNDLKQQLNIMELKLQNKEKYFKQDHKKYRQKLNQVQRQKYAFALQIEHLKSALEQKQIRARSQSVQQGKVSKSEKQRLLKKNQQLKYELKILTKFKDNYSAEIEAFNLLISNHKIQNQHLRNEIVFYKQQCARLKGLVEENQTEKRKIESLKKSEHHLLNETNHRINVFEIQLKRLQAHNSTIQKDLELKNTIEANLNEKISEYRNMYHECQSKYHKLESEYKQSLHLHSLATSSQQNTKSQKQQFIFMNKQFQSQLDFLKQQNNQRQFQCQQQIQALRNELRETMLKNKKLSQNYEHMKYQRDSELIENRRIKHQSTENQQKEKVFKDKIRKYQQLVQNCKDEILSKEKIQRELENKIINLESDNKLKHNTISTLQHHKQINQRKLNGLQKQLKQLQQQVESKQEQIRKINKTILLKDNQIEEYKQKISSLQISLIGGNSKFESIQSSIKIINEEKQRQRLNSQQIRRDNEDIKIVYAEAKEKLSKVQQQLFYKQQQLKRRTELQQAIRNELINKSHQFQEYKKTQLQIIKSLSQSIVKQSYQSHHLKDEVQQRANEFQTMQLRLLETLEQNKINNSNKINKLSLLNNEYQNNIMTLTHKNLQLTNKLKTSKDQIQQQKISHLNNMTLKINEIQILNSTISQEKIQLNSRQQKIISLIKQKQSISMELNLQIAKNLNNENKIDELKMQLEELRSTHNIQLVKLSALNNLNPIKQNVFEQQTLKSKQRQIDYLIQSINKSNQAKLQQDQSYLQAIKENSQFKINNQILNQTAHQLQTKIHKLEFDASTTKFNIEYLENKIAELQHEIKISEQQRFDEMRNNQNMAKVLKQLKQSKNKQQNSVLSSNHQLQIKEANQVTSEIDKLRSERKELDNRYFMIRKQSFKKYKNLQIKQTQINKKLNQLKHKQQMIQSKIKQYNHLKYQKQNSTAGLNNTTHDSLLQSFENNKLQNQICCLNKEIDILKEELYDGKQQFKGEQQLLRSLQNQLSANKQLLNKALEDLSLKEEKMNLFSRKSLEQYTSQIQIREELILNLKKIIQSVESQKNLQEERFKSITNNLQHTIQTLKRNLKDKTQTEQIANASMNKQYQQHDIKNIMKQKQDLKHLLKKQKQSNQKVQEENLKRFQTYINNILNQKDKLFLELEQNKESSLKSTQVLQNKCLSLQKQLGEARRQINLLKNHNIPIGQSTTYFMKSINQYQQVNKQFIDKFRDIQKSIELTQSQKIKLINKIREFVLILLRCKTKNLEKGVEMKEVKVILDEYKLLQKKINYLVEYSFRVFEMDVPAQFEGEINDSIEEYMLEIVNLKQHKQDILGLNPADKFKRVQRSLSLINDKNR